MKYILFIILLSISGCSTISIGKPWPTQQDAYLLESCSQLLQIEKGKYSMAEIVDIVEANYGKWHECKIKTDGWIKWYTTHWKKDK
jgi:hypothetical protein